MSTEVTSKNDNEDIILDPKKSLLSSLLNCFGKFFVSDKKIGELNGKWAFIFKTVLLSLFICIPTFIGWASWTTTSIWDNTSEIKHIQNYIYELPPKAGCTPTNEWRRRIETTENENKEAKKEINLLEKTNATEHSQILILLEGIKTKLEILVKQ